MLPFGNSSADTQSVQKGVGRVPGPGAEIPLQPW